MRILIILITLLIATISCRSQTDELYILERKEIELRINSEHEIYIDNQLTPFDSIGREIIKLTKDFSQVEIDNFVVSLNIDKEVKIGLMSDVQEQLRIVNARRIVYKAK